MIYTNVLILLFLIIIYILSKKHNHDISQNIDKKKYKLTFLYPMAGYLLNKSGLEKRLLNKSEVSQKIRALYISDHQDIQARLYWYQKTSLILLIIFIFSSLSLLTSVQTGLDNTGSFDGVIVRPDEEEGDTQVRLKFRMENEENHNDFYEDEIVIENKTRTYSDEEWKRVLDRAIPYLEQKMLGKNENAECVSTDLYFIDKIPGTGITVEWVPSDYRLISAGGVLQNTDMTDSKVDTTVKAILKYRDRRVEHIISLTIWPQVSDDKEKLYKKLQNIIEETEKQNDRAEKWSLPRKLGEYKINWEEPISNAPTSIFILGLTAALLIWLLGDKELQKKMNIRNNQMLLDYPEIINKFNLLINAGMTIKQAWLKIAEDYKKKTDEKGGQTRYAYEEMVVTLHELKLGIPESQAYEQFGQRAGLLPYMKFASLLVQNLKKGNKDMVDLLKREALEAIHERKETVKRLGEEASTKLLGPMLLMLFIVLIIIMIPAFISFKI